ncbi:BlaI/MecI/CopY family transcriptional regulator [Mucilaginibacter arboris]|uniref:BlaI/MecI/CopY family transcriptional regulator n=1 Tax=Mucilaginibacter arboris TaxID=2682090 RepID=A0A7K1SSS5_9SPHI|nr:BlaI/MecI/CopY family transcriptional regulator [Mucilaginibacter arboris]MVN20366.1 BlaI/MecI/CopY family transcriptional regulator [Mucilaginibacter arboris]
MSIKPTESELEILQILWQKGAGTVREVNEELSKIKQTEIGYTTTLKLMQLMHEKGLVERDASNRTHVYKALLNQQKTQKNLVNKLIDSAFNGSASQLVMQALSNHQTSPQELEAIKKYLEQLNQK